MYHVVHKMGNSYRNSISVWIAHFMYDLVHFFAVYLPYCSQCYLVSMPGHKLFPLGNKLFPRQHLKMVSSYRNLICSLAVFTQGSQLGKNVNSGWSIFITREIQNNFVELNLTRDENWQSLVHVFSRARPFRILLRRKQNTYLFFLSHTNRDDNSILI